MAILAQTYTTTDAAASTGVGIVILLVYLVLAAVGIAFFVLAIMNAIDFTKHSDAAWEASGTTKSTALVIVILQFFCCAIGWALTLYYWFSLKPKVTAAEGPGYAG